MNVRIEHVALYVNDLEGARRFFERFFGAASNGGYHNPRTGLRTYFLTFAGGARLELMTRPDVVPAEKPEARAGYAHLALSVGSRERVDALTEELRSAGYRVASGPRETGDGYYESCVLDAEGNRIEIAQ